MAQHDYVIANGTGAAVRSDLNNALAAIVSQNSGATAPSTTYAYQWWADTTTGLLKLRNAANNGWITLFQLDGEWSTIALENGSAAAPSIYFKDSGTDTGVYSPGTDQVAISTGGTGRLFVDSSGRVGLGTSTPQSQLSVVGPVGTLNDSGGTLLLATDAAGTDALGALGAGVTFAQRWQGFSGAVRVAGIYGVKGSPTSNYGGQLAFYTQPVSGADMSQRMVITAVGNVGIGTTTPLNIFDVKPSTNRHILFSPSSAYANNAVVGVDDGGNEIALGIAGNPIQFFTGVTERVRIDSSGRLLVGTSTSTAVGGAAALSQIETGANIGLSILRRGDVPIVAFGRTGGSGATVVNNGDELGRISFAAADGTDIESVGAQISATIDGTPGSNDTPGRLVFSTTADGASSPTEAMRITQSGSVLIQTTQLASTTDGCYFNSTTNSEFHQLLCHSSSTSSLANLYINRQASDGTLIEFRQADTAEGSISVSGTTVTYGGGHLARWSQLPNDEDPSGILKGTVMSNLDEMCEWGDEDNEQLNKTKVSDIEGDPNVAGLFVSTSFSEDGPLDFWLAMTGDMIIRIAEGVTVQRGDLLMSAGDGTAKPQDDDIIRSKTVAKVTSTHVTCTYDDGSYCVPCVLMAC